MNPIYLFRRQETPIRKLLMMHLAAGGKLIEYTATGNPLSFVTDVAKNLTQLLIPWTPTQSGTGDPSPTNIRPITGVSGVNVWRTGKNLFDEQYPGILESSVVTYRAIYVGEGTFTLSSDVTKNTSDGRNLFFLAGNVSSGASSTTNGVYNGNPITQTSVGGYVTVAYRKYNVGETADPTKSHTMLTSGSSAAEYEPYSGSTYPVTFPALGKNLFDANNMTIVNGYMGGTVGNYTFTESNYAKSFVIPCEPNTQYTVTRKNAGSMFGVATTDELHTSGSFSLIDFSNYNTPGCSTKELHITTSATAKYLYVWYYRSQSDSDYDTTLEQMMVEKGSTVTTYEPYTSTVYGGSLNLTTGVLTATHYGFDPLSCNHLKFSSTTSSTTTGYIYFANETLPVFKSATLISNRFSRNISSGNAGRTVQTATSIYFVIATSELETADEAGFRKWFAEHQTLFLAELETAQTWQLTPEQINTLIGTNTIWTDTNGSNTAKYLKKG